jgi:predicted PurR-regulated permease PerM
MIRFDITENKFWKILFTLGVFALLYLIRDVVALIFFSIILTASLNPFVDYLEKRKVPRELTSSLSLLGIFGSVFLIFQSIVPQILDELRKQIPTLTQKLPEFINSLGLNESTKNELSTQTVNALKNSTGTLTNNIVQTGFTFANGLLALFVVVILSYYLLVQHTEVKRFVMSFFSLKDRRQVFDIWVEIEQKLGVWLRGQLVIMLIVTAITYIALILIQVDFALPLAILSGALVVIPFVGPNIAAVPTIIIAAIDSPTKALLVTIFFVIIQQLESAYIIPKVMNKAVGLNPILIIVAVMIGARLGDIVGAIIAVPVAAVLMIFFEEFQNDGSKVHK